MITATLFITSITEVILFLLSNIFDRKMPIPFLHLYNVTAMNCYLYTPALIYQVYFWAKFADII